MTALQRHDEIAALFRAVQEQGWAELVIDDGFHDPSQTDPLEVFEKIVHQSKQLGLVTRVDRDNAARTTKLRIEVPCPHPPNPPAQQLPASSPSILP